MSNKRAVLAMGVARVYGYTDEYEGRETLLSELFSGVEHLDLPRYLVIATEAAGEGPADNSKIFSSKAIGKKWMGGYAREGWASTMWDLDTGSTIYERNPR